MEYVKLKDVFELQMGKTPARSNAEYWGGKNKWIAISDLSDDTKNIYETKEYITDKAVQESGIRKVKKGTVIMSFKLSIGKVAITGEDMYTNEAIMAFIDKGKYNLDTQYLYYLFKGTDWSSGTNKAVLGLTLNKATLSEKKIPIPNIDMQKEIVLRLNLVTDLIDKHKKQLEKLDELVKARFVEMFGDVTNNDKNWHIEPLGNLCDISRGGSPRPIEQYLGGTIPWIKIGDATDGDDIYLTKTKEKILEIGIKKSRLVKSGSLIFANCGVSLGFARIITFDGCIHDGWLSFENIDENLDKIFLLKSLNCMTEYFRSIAPSGTQPNLNTAIMKSYKQIVPPIELQNQFADFVKQVEKTKTEVQKSLEQAETLKKALMQKYFG